MKIINESFFDNFLQTFLAVSLLLLINKAPELVSNLVEEGGSLVQLAFDQDKSSIYKLLMEDTPEFKFIEEDERMGTMARIVTKAVEENKPKILQMLIEEDYSLVVHAALARPRS